MTKRVAYIGEDIDAAKELAAELMQRGARGAAADADADPLAPLVEITVYAGIDQETLASAIAFAVEGVWAGVSFPGMAHVAHERHEALIGADLVVDAAFRELAPAAPECARYEDTLRMDMMILAPAAELRLLG